MALVVCAAWLFVALHEGRPHVYCERHQALEERADAQRTAAGPFAAVDAAPAPPDARAETPAPPIALLANAPKASPPRAAA